MSRVRAPSITPTSFKFTMTISRMFDVFETRRLTYARLECDMGNRYLCDVLGEMKQCWETRNFAPINGLIEECQTLANRMESALSDKRNVLTYEQRRPQLKDEIKELEWKKEELEEQVRSLEFRIKELKHDNPELKEKE